MTRMINIVNERGVEVELPSLDFSKAYPNPEHEFPKVETLGLDSCDFTAAWAGASSPFTIDFSGVPNTSDLDNKGALAKRMTCPIRLGKL